VAARSEVPHTRDAPEEVKTTSPAPPTFPQKKTFATCLIVSLVGLVLCGVAAVALLLGVVWLGSSPTDAPHAPSHADSPSNERVAASPHPERPTPAEPPGDTLEDLVHDPHLSGTRADETLRRDVLQAVLAGMTPKDCRVAPQGVHLLSPPQENGAWIEGWDVSICNKKKRLRITFTPTADGGTDYSISS
jgi:hypothetical protein